MAFKVPHILQDQKDQIEVNYNFRESRIEVLTPQGSLISVTAISDDDKKVRFKLRSTIDKKDSDGVFRKCYVGFLPKTFKHKEYSNFKIEYLDPYDECDRV